MVSMEEAAQMAVSLPEVTEGARHGNRTWFVGGKAFTAMPPCFIQLDKVTKKALKDALVDGWLAVAPERLVAQFEGRAGDLL